MQNLLFLTTQAHTLALAFAGLHATVAGSVPSPTVDTTGTNQALINLARWGGGLTGGFVMLAFVWQGLQYMVTHDLNRSTHLKISAMGILGGAMLALLSITLAPEFVKLILNQ